MTLGQLFGASVGPSSVQYYDSYPTGASDGIFTDRDGGSGYGYGSSKSKGTDKKQLALSALTLLAFLFFLNILQNCLKEQLNKRTETPAAAYVLAGPYGSQQRTPEEELEDNNISRKSRRLLQVDDITTTTETAVTTEREASTKPLEVTESVTERGTTEQPLTTEAWSYRTTTDDPRTSRLMKYFRTTTESTRTSKFIENYEPDRNWKNELSQLTDEEIREQRIKTRILSLLQKNRNAGESAIKSVDFQNEMKKQKNFADFKEFVEGHNEVEERAASFAPEEQQIENSIKEIQGTLRNNEIYTAHDATIRPELFHNVQNDPVVDLGTQAYFQAQVGVLNTPRTRRSESTTEAYVDEDVEEFKRNLMTQTPLPMTTTTLEAPELRLTTRPYVYHFRQGDTSHRYTNHKYDEESKHDKKEHRFHSSLKKVMMNNLQTKKKPTPKYKKPYRVEDVSITTERSYNSYRPHSRYYTHAQRPSYPYRPVRRIPHYQEEDLSTVDMTINFMKYVWNMLSSFTKPISRLMPLQRIGQEENQKCYDLLICEAHRASKLLGPSAQKMADTFSEVLAWVSTPEAKADLLKAVNSAKYNTCQEQITNCESLQGKSTMTVVAQILENRHRKFDK